MFKYCNLDQTFCQTFGTIGAGEPVEKRHFLKVYLKTLFLKFEIKVVT